MRFVLLPALLSLMVTPQPGSAAASEPRSGTVPSSVQSFSQPWHINLPRPVMLAAWERLKRVEIPAVPTDQRFAIDGPVYHVSPNGDDAADGSKERPWKTLQFAVTKLKPGTVINLRAGTYYGPVEIRTKATEQAPAALRAMSGEEVVITYEEAYMQEQRSHIASVGKEGAADANGKQLHYPSLITLIGSWVEISGLHLVGARDRLPMNLYSESGISIAGGRGEGCRVLYNEIENTGHCGVKEMGHGGKDFLIEGNYIHDLGQTFHDHGIYLPADDVTVRRNLLLNATGWGVHAYTTPKRLLISHNVFGGNAEDGLILGGSQCNVLNNIFYHDHKGGVFFFRRGCQSNTIVNNILIEPAPFRVDSAGSAAPDAQPRGNRIDYNCLPGGLGTVSVLDTFGPHNLEADPRFIDAASLDFRLQPGSPCIDAGDTTVMEKFFGKAPEIGLYEQQPGRDKGR